MGEYVININWNGGGGGRSGGGRGNITTSSFLMNPAATTEAAATIAAGAAAIPMVANQTATNPAAFFASLQSTNNKSINQRQNIPLTPTDFFSRNRNILWNDNARDKDNNTEDIITHYKRIYLYASAQVIRLANLGFSTHYQYASAIANSTAELNAVNEYQNAMTGIGLAGSIAAGAVVGAKVGSVAGPVGTAIGAGVGTAIATINKAVSTWNENRILNYKQAINATTSAYQLGVLGDATYGRSRQSIG